MSLIDGAPRSATVEATTPMRLLVVGQREFWQLLATAPAISRRIMHAMAERLREANAAYSANP
jgi:CRP-like cAMP-binding protein